MNKTIAEQNLSMLEEVVESLSPGRIESRRSEIKRLISVAKYSKRPSSTKFSKNHISANRRVSRYKWI